MALNIKTGIQPRPQKVVIYGPEGIGKTTLASKFPEPLILDLEGGSSQIDVSKIDDIRDWNGLAAAIAEICNSPDQLCKTLVIDTADAAEAFCCKAVCQANGKKGIEEFGYGKGYKYLSEQFSAFISYLDIVIKNGMNVVLIAHAMMRKFEQPDELGAYDRWELKLTKYVSPMVKEWADMLLFCNYKTDVVLVDGGKAKASGGKRVMYASHHACWDAKNRHGLPDMMEMDYSSIKEAIEGKEDK